MKRSPTSSCSSSSSCIDGTKGDMNAIVPRRTRAKRTNTGPVSAKRRSSVYRGVTRHRWTGRYEAHLWDKNTWNSIQNKKGRQIYLGAYDKEDAAARTYDLAALKYWGQATNLNFPIETYAKEVEEMGKVTKEEYLASLRRRSSGFSRGVSKYRGVARHHHNGRWEARIGRVMGSKYMYLGTYSTQEEAAAAYDLAAIEYRGAAAITNFDISTYADKLKHLQQPQPDPVGSTALMFDEKEADQQTDPMCSALMNIDRSEEPWDFCLDVDLLPDIPYERSAELPDLFSDAGFEDDIDFMFENELKLESPPYGAKEETSTSSSSSSITSNVLPAADSSPQM